MNDFDTPVYPMRTVTRLTRVPAGKLRFWESRYGFLKPKRTPGGHRLYSKRDIQVIARVHELVEEQGYSLLAAAQIVEAQRESAALAVSED